MSTRAGGARHKEELRLRAKQAGLDPMAAAQEASRLHLDGLKKDVRAMLGNPAFRTVLDILRGVVEKFDKEKIEMTNPNLAADLLARHHTKRLFEVWIASMERLNRPEKDA